MHNINSIPGVLKLGNQGDFGHTIVIDVSAWADLLPDRYEITCGRPGESSVYPITNRVFADNTLTWTLEPTDTELSGSGTIVIEAYRGTEELKHTPIIQTRIGAGHPAAGAAPTPVANWVAAATAKLGEVDHFVDEAVTATENADTATGLTLAAISGAETATGLADAATLAANNAAGLAIENAGLAEAATAAAQEASEFLYIGEETPTSPNAKIWFDTNEPELATILADFEQRLAALEALHPE